MQTKKKVGKCLLKRKPLGEKSIKKHLSATAERCFARIENRLQACQNFVVDFVSQRQSLSQNGFALCLVLVDKSFVTDAA